MSGPVQRLAVICAGQGAQAELDFSALRPGADDAVEAHDLWRAASAQLGGDWQDQWSTLDAVSRRANRVAQLAVALWQGLQWLRVRTELPTPAWVIGYSAGEVAAQAIAGSLAFADVPGLMTARAEAMDAACGVADSPCLVLLGSRLPAAARQRREAALQRHGLCLSIQRTPAEAVWAAPAAQIAAFLADATQDGGWDARAVDVRVPSHSVYLQPALHPWRAALAACAVQAPQTGVLAGITGDPVRTADAVRSTLVDQLAQPIQWSDVLQGLLERGVTRVLDLGPGSDQGRLLEAQQADLQLFQVSAGILVRS